MKEERDRLIVRRERRCRRRLGDWDDRTGFSFFKCNKARRVTEVKYLAKRISNRRMSIHEEMPSGPV